MRFYLGTHAAGWLAHLNVPLFVSHRRLKRLKRLPVSVTPWALDSGGYTELRLHGGWQLASHGLALHGFGVKINGLGRYGWALASADSLAWSYGARFDPPLPGCTHKTCNNCRRFAVLWHAKVERAVNRPQQTSLALGDVA